MGPTCIRECFPEYDLERELLLLRQEFLHSHATPDASTCNISCGYMLLRMTHPITFNELAWRPVVIKVCKTQPNPSLKLNSGSAMIQGYFFRAFFIISAA